MKNLLFIPIFLLGLLVTGCSDDEDVLVGNIYGIVTNHQTGEPVKNASVILSPSNRTTVTGDDGHYEFAEVDPGQYKIQVSAKGFFTDSRQISVTAAQRVSCDIAIKPKEENPSVKLSSTHLNFGTSLNELVLNITNTGNSGTVSWNISSIDVSWLSVSPISGEVNMGKSESIKVKINRSSITKEETTFFTVEAAGGSTAVMVSVSPTGGNTPDDPNQPDTPDDPNQPDKPTEEDYSSADVIVNNSSVSAKIISCRRYGTSVEFYYLLENNNLVNAKQFRVLTPFNRMNNTKTTIFYDNQNTGNEYNDIDMTFRGKGMSQSNSQCVEAEFPIGIPCKCSVILKNVDPKVKEMNFIIAFYNYSGTKYNEDIKFYDVPIY